MENDEKLKIKVAVNSFVKQKGLSKNELAIQLQISSATLSNIEYERWDLLKNEMLVRVWNAVKPSNEWVLIKTSNFETAFELCNDARMERKLVGLIGYPGAGKTTALKQYYRQHPNTWYVSGQKSMKPRRFFEKLLRQMGVMFTGTIFDMIERLSQELNNRPGSILIIDEAGKFDDTMFMYLHDLRNETEETTGIILAGVEYFKANLEKAVTKQKQGMPEFFSRIISWQILQRPSRNEIKAICEQNGVTETEYVNQIQRSKDFRSVSNGIKNVLLIQKQNHHEPILN